MKRLVIFFFTVLFIQALWAHNVVNVYAWGGVIPKEIIQQFEHDTRIKVNFSSYDSNETMYAKLKASRQNVYDVILPSAYYVERMKKQNMLAQLDHSKLTNVHHIDSFFSKNEYDLGDHYSIPLIWGATGIFYNNNWVKNPPQNWKQLWQKPWRQQLLLLDDAREVFSMALLTLGYHPNDNDPAHIKEAYQQLLKLIPNIKLFASDSIQAIMIDEDAIAGATWNGDAYKAHAEKKAVNFIYPKDGFVIWVDCLAIPANPPHREEAYQFINYMLNPNIAAKIALEGNAITNASAKLLLPETLRNNTMVYPTAETLERGYFQRDVGDKTIELYNNYWEQFKFAF